MNRMAVVTEGLGIFPLQISLEIQKDSKTRRARSATKPVLEAAAAPESVTLPTATQGNNKTSQHR